MVLNGIPLTYLCKGQLSTTGLGRQVQLSLVSWLECGKAPRIVKTNMAVYNACIISLPPKWQRDMERRLNTFHPRSIRSILGISWQDADLRLVSCWPSHYVHSAQTMQTAMVGSCPRPRHFFINSASAEHINSRK